MKDREDKVDNIDAEKLRIFIDEIWPAKVKTFLKEVVPETGIDPNSENWQLIALAIAMKHAPQMQDSPSRGRPTLTDVDIVFKHEGRLADVAHYKHEHGCTLEEARENVGLPLGTYKLWRRTYKTLWKAVKSDPDIARITSNMGRRSKRNE